MPISRLATESRPSQAQCSSWQLATAVERSGRSGPSLVRGGLPPQRPPLFYHRACAIPARRRRHRACAAPAVRITNHESRQLWPFRPSLVRGGHLPQRPPVLCYRACASPASRRRHRACAAPTVRITNHESRITAVMAVPALPCAGGHLPQRLPVLCYRACASPASRRRHRACAAPTVRITNHESRITNHGSYGRSGPPSCGGTPTATPPCVKSPCLRAPSLPSTSREQDAVMWAHRQPIAPSTGPCSSWPLATVHRPLLTIHYPLQFGQHPFSRRPFAQYQILSIINRAVESQNGQMLSAPTICSATRTGPAFGLGPRGSRFANRQHPQNVSGGHHGFYT